MEICEIMGLTKKDLKKIKKQRKRKKARQTK